MTSSSNIGLERVLEALPHRPPFLLVDDVKDLVLGESCVGIKEVKPDEGYFKGHFPDYPIMPGVLIIEALAQTAGILLYWSLKDSIDFKSKLVVLAGVEKAKFRKSIFPGDTVELFVKRECFRNPIYKISGEAKVRGQTMVTATITAVMTSKKDK